MWQIHNFLLIIIKYFRCFFTSLCAICLIFIGYSFLFASSKIQSVSSPTCDFYLPRVKIFGVKNGEKTLAIVETVFRDLGYTVQTNDSLNWDVLWSYTYPFYVLEKELSSLKSYQKVNHFPGSGFITQKSNLASLKLNNIPKSFILPIDKEHFIEYAQKNQNKSWIMKSSTHRFMHIVNLTSNLDENGVFIQEFIQNPLLINNKKFDIGVYVILTSINPLRVYIYSEDVLLRFCKKDYYPLNLSSPESYIVGDDYLPIWKVPDLQFYFSELNYTAKVSLNAYLLRQGMDVKKMWLQIHEAIQDVYYETEDNLKYSSSMFSNKRNFFELVRFDFIADAELNVHLLEVNMSPNLSPAHFSQNALLYEQIVLSTLNIAGFVRKFPTVAQYSGEAEVSEKDLIIFPEQCSSQICFASCKALHCKVCTQCLTDDIKEIFKTAYEEFINRGKYRRLIPLPSIKKQDQRNKSFLKSSILNSLMAIWFEGKCLQDISWCY